MSWKEKDFEERMTKYIDCIYHDIFGKRLEKIIRNDRSSETESKLMFMDIELSIDTHLYFQGGSVLTFQEKTRKNRFITYNDFTFEYYNDPNTKAEGEWFKLASQLYFFGYANEKETGYDKYWIINVAKLRTGLMQMFTMKEMEQKFLRRNQYPAKATFFAIPFNELEKMNNVILLKR